MIGEQTRCLLVLEKDGGLLEPLLLLLHSRPLQLAPLSNHSNTSPPHSF